MDTSKSLIKNISQNRDLNWVIKSYRVYKKLEISDKNLVDSLPNFTLRDYTLMLYAKSGKRLSLAKCKELAIGKQKVITKKLLGIQRETSRLLHYTNESQKAKALEFHGFVSQEKLPKRFLRKGYAYITSNTLIQGKLYIFPRRLYDDIKYKDSDITYWQNLFEDLILPGLIRVYYSFEYKNLKRNARY